VIRYRARWVVPVSRPPIAEGVVAVEGDRIAFVGRAEDAPRQGELVDLGDAVLTPGLVNAHTHLELTAMRGFLEDLPFRDWIVTLTAAKREVLTREQLLDAARLGVREGLRAGITTFADTCDSGVAAQAMREAGVRGIMYQEVFGPDPAQCDRSMAELRAKVDALRAEETALVRIGISPHAPYTVSDALFSAAADYARVEQLPMAIHIAESAEEHALVTEGAGMFAEGLRRRGIAVAPRARTPIQLLEAAGVLARSPLLIHCVRVDAADVERIVRTHCGVAHCPSSNAKLGHGVAPLAEWLEAGVAVGLGSDSVASNNRMDVLEEARLASLMQRARLGRPDAVSAAAAFELATIGGARALRLDGEVGALEPGGAADLAAFMLGEERGVHCSDPVTALVFALAGGHATFVAVAGEVKVRGGIVVGATGELRARVQKCAEILTAWRREQKARES
jgi:cytosine/adenosine deaminase-related metal-dependent hydrolase